MHQVQQAQKQANIRLLQADMKNQFEQDQFKKQINRSFNQSIRDEEREKILDYQASQQKLQDKIAVNNKTTMRMLAQHHKKQVEDKKKLDILEKELILKQERDSISINLKNLDQSNFSRAKQNTDWYNNLKTDWKVMSQKRQHSQIVAKEEKKSDIKMMEENTNKEIRKELAYQNKFKQIDMDIKRKMDQFTNKVLKPKAEESLKAESNSNEMILNFKNKQDKIFTQQNTEKRRAVNSYYKEVNDQINQSKFRKSIDRSLYDYDKEDMIQKVTTSLDFDQMARQERFRKQKQYKDMLNYQCQLNK